MSALVHRFVKLGDHGNASWKCTTAFAVNLSRYDFEVIPAKTGIQGFREGGDEADLYAAVENLLNQGRGAVRWIPACAGMTPDYERVALDTGHGAVAIRARFPRDR